MIRVVVDLGNTRLKWGVVGPDGAVRSGPPVPVAEPGRWPEGFAVAGLDREPSRWAVASVHPGALATLQEVVAAWPVRSFGAFRAADDVAQPHRLAAPDRTGVDRALGVLAARGLAPAGTALLVASCGSAITVDAVDAAGVWRGGAIAPGLPLASRALHAGTAQLPHVPEASSLVPAIGDATVPAIQAGLHWGLVGAVRELLGRQAMELGAEPVAIFTGGDAPWIARHVAGAGARVVPDLVLRGLAVIGFPP